MYIRTINTINKAARIPPKVAPIHDMSVDLPDEAASLPTAASVVAPTVVEARVVGSRMAQTEEPRSKQGSLKLASQHAQCTPTWHKQLAPVGVLMHVLPALQGASWQ